MGKTERKSPYLGFFIRVGGIRRGRKCGAGSERRGSTGRHTEEGGKETGTNITQSRSHPTKTEKSQKTPTGYEKKEKKTKESHKGNNCTGDHSKEHKQRYGGTTKKKRTKLHE